MHQKTYAAHRMSVPLPTDGVPHATTKHTIAGYAWGDVTTALLRAVANGDMARALRWSAELVCSELGLGRLEATLFHAWALHVGPAAPSWCASWAAAVKQIRAFWQKSGGDIRSVRNTPLVRQLVAESVASLVLATKKPLPALPSPADCFREAESMRTRLRNGGGAGDQMATRHVWSAEQDGPDLKTVCNEMEAALRSNQIGRLLFWIVWMITLDGQADAPVAKERGPAHLTPKQRKSLLWFLIDVLQEIMNDVQCMSVQDRTAMFELLGLAWTKLGARGRRDVLAAIALTAQEHIQKRTSLQLMATTTLPALQAVRTATAHIDKIYSIIAEESRQFMLEAPSIVGLTADQAAASLARQKPRTVLSADDKMHLMFALAPR